ncbi:hypothetical protein [Rugosimonospora acidiphila]|uniref:hypothetical protein n=1 Tax=Rugosimonospora acidiphila TaxID=556531 RepID=UPI0031EF842B
MDADERPQQGSGSGVGGRPRFVVREQIQEDIDAIDRAGVIAGPQVITVAWARMTAKASALRDPGNVGEVGQ